MRNPLCFVLMPFGRQRDAGGRSVDFDAVYQRVVRPAIERAGLEPIRAEEASPAASSTRTCSSGWRSAITW